MTDCTTVNEGTTNPLEASLCIRASESPEEICEDVSDIPSSPGQDIWRIVRSESTCIACFSVIPITALPVEPIMSFPCGIECAIRG
jgi:hypothetical protein